MHTLQAQELATALGGPLLLSKGQVDIITDGQQQLVVTADGSPRRCGGQGDVLTGVGAQILSGDCGKAVAAVMLQHSCIQHSCQCPSHPLLSVCNCHLPWLLLFV